MTRNTDMIVVIQCASGKRANAGHLVSKEGRKVMFVANPGRAPESESVVYQRPDDLESPESPGRSYRDVLVEYNQREREENPLDLLPAWKLYENQTYASLAEKFGTGNLYILSAGWGLIEAEFLTPNYDITVSTNVTFKGENGYNRRSVNDSRYRDFSRIPRDVSSHVVFLGGTDYVWLFWKLTAGIARRTLFHKSCSPPSVPDCTLKRYETTTRTNWHYECARALIDGSISV